MDHERYLADVIDALTAAASQDACVQIAARAASELADVYGLCLLSADGDDSVIALASREPLYLCNLRHSGVYRMALSMRRAADSNQRLLSGRDDFITLPTGQQRRIRVALLVPLKCADFLAVGFLWQPGQISAPHRGRWLELLARALDLAARGWKEEEEHATQRRVSVELQHRLRNNLALVRSIIRRSHETAESAEHFSLHLEARIGALTRIQAALVAAGADGVDLEDLVRTELTASAALEQRYAMLGPTIRMHDRGAELLALAVHELVTNSLKFGALATPSGHLSIRWSVTGGMQPRLHLKWHETGVAVASTAPRRQGFGQELIELTLPYELEAHTRLAFEPGCVTCEIDVPLEMAEASIAPEPRVAIQGAGPW